MNFWKTVVARTNRVKIGFILASPEFAQDCVEEEIFNNKSQKLSQITFL